MEELKARVFGQPNAPTRDAVKFFTVAAEGSQ